MFASVGTIAQGDADADRHDQKTRSRQRDWVRPRRRRAGMVLAPERRAGELRRVERGGARQLRRRAIGERAPRNQRARPKLTRAGSDLARIILFDIDGTLVLTG